MYKGWVSCVKQNGSVVEMLQILGNVSLGFLDEITRKVGDRVTAGMGRSIWTENQCGGLS